MASVEALLRGIARKQNKRVQRCQLYDRNACDFHWDKLEVRRDTVSNKFRVCDPIILSGGPFTHKLKFLHNEQSVLLWANRETILVSVRGELRQSVSCSVNHPNANGFMQATRFAVEGNWNAPVFIRSALKPTEELREFLCSSEVKDAVRALIKQENDSLHFDKGETSLYFHPQSESEITNAIEILCRFVGSVRPQRELWDLRDLPHQFQHLAPFIQSWAECDDEERSELLSEASDLSLRTLIQSVVPLFDSISAFLHSFGDAPLPEAAIALQALAESAAEAQVVIKDRTSQN